MDDAAILVSLTALFRDVFDDDDLAERARRAVQDL